MWKADVHIALLTKFRGDPSSITDAGIFVRPISFRIGPKLIDSVDKSVFFNEDTVLIPYELLDRETEFRKRVHSLELRINRCLERAGFEDFELLNPPQSSNFESYKTERIEYFTKTINLYNVSDVFEVYVEDLHMYAVKDCVRVVRVSLEDAKRILNLNGRVLLLFENEKSKYRQIGEELRQHVVNQLSDAFSPIEDT